MLDDEEEKKEEVQPVEQDITETLTGKTDDIDLSSVQNSGAEAKEKADLENILKNEKATLEAATAAEKSDLEKFASTTKDTGIISAINESYTKASEQYNNAVRTEGSPVKDAYELRDKINNMQDAHGEFNKQKGEIGGTIAVNYAMGAATGGINGAGAESLGGATGGIPGAEGLGGATGGIPGAEGLGGATGGIPGAEGLGGNAANGLQMPESQVAGNGGNMNDLIKQLRQGKNPNLTGGDNSNQAKQITDLVQTAAQQHSSQSEGQEKSFLRRTDDEFKAALDLGDKMLTDTPIIGEMHRNVMAQMKVTDGIDMAHPLAGNPDMDQKRDGLAGRLASIQEGDIARAATGRAQKPSKREVINAMRQGRNPLDASQNKEKPQKAKSPIDAKQMTDLIKMAKSDVVKS